MNANCFQSAQELRGSAKMTGHSQEAGNEQGELG